MTSSNPTDNPLPPDGCTCASFWTVRQQHKSDCPYADSQADEELRQKIVQYQINAYDNLTRNQFKSIALPEMMLYVDELQAKHTIAVLRGVLEKLPKMLTEKSFEQLKMDYPELDKTDFYHFGLDQSKATIQSEIDKLTNPPKDRKIMVCNESDAGGSI